MDVMTLNENHDAEFIAKVMKERDRVLTEKRATLGGSEKSFRTRERREQRGHATQECSAPTDEAGASGEQESDSGPRCSTEGASASGAGVPGAGVPDEVHTRRTPEIDRGFDGRQHSSESLCRKFNCRPRQCARGAT